MCYYRHDLALVHARGFGQHADSCAPGILELLAPVRDGLVLEVGCGSGALAIDICDLEYGTIRAGAESVGRVGADWAVITRYATPAPDRFVRDITTFVLDDASGWRRDDECHENVLVDTSRIPALLAEQGVRAAVGPAFGDAELPPGMRAVIGRKWDKVSRFDNYV